jgi:hypothetical protein
MSAITSNLPNRGRIVSHSEMLYRLPVRNRMNSALYNRAPAFEAEVRFLTPEEGGRSGKYGPVKQGYRCDIHFDDDPSDLHWMIWPAFLDEGGQELPKGTDVPPLSKAYFYIANDDLRRTVHREWIREGVTFHLCEGARRVAACRVIKLLRLNEDL